MNIHEQNYVLISANQRDNGDQENARLQARLCCDLLALVGYTTGVVQTSGSYDGFEEESYAVILPNPIHYPAEATRIQNGVIELGNKYNQNFLVIVLRGHTPAEATFFPLNRTMNQGWTKSKTYAWVEVDHEPVCSDRVAGFTRVLDKIFVADLTSNKVPIDYVDTCDDMHITHLADMLDVIVDECDGECRSFDCNTCPQMN